jgi:AraC-like DNA-binding protein
MAQRGTISKIDAYRMAKADQQTADTMREITAISKLAGYRKPATARGSTARYFFQHLQKLKAQRGWS